MSAAIVKYRLRHRTTYAYVDSVDLASHMLHLSPRTTDRQRVIAAEILCEPAPSARTAAPDHFGNGVTWLFLERPHTRLELVLNALVEVSLGEPAGPAGVAWDALGGAAPWDVAEFLFDSPLAPAIDAARAYAADSFSPGRDAFDAVRHLSGRIRREFAFRPGATSISTPLAQVFAQRAGVCQDFSHAMIAALRAHRVPARYVSGYIRTRPKPGEERRRGADVSHAWVAAWLGPRLGWVEVDPTNDLVVGGEHVVLGHGRDYADVSPVRGVLLGGGRHAVTVGVDLEPVE
jgi:transglutaminase-like putative cysteine protease